MRHTASRTRRLAVAGIITVSMLAVAAPAAAQTGGTGTPGGTTPTTPTTTPTTTTAPVGPPGRAIRRKDGTAVAPADAPPAIQAAIAAGNAIKHLPYRWGGGHRTFFDSGYDCSGAVSRLLNAAGMLSSPLPSGPLARSWGVPGKGRWITVYANASHAYMVVAGLRFDTSAVGEKLNQGSGPRWRATKRKPLGYTAKYFPGY
jgi:cell wall-associated NlpC family hydrolase